MAERPSGSEGFKLVNIARNKLIRGGAAVVFGTTATLGIACGNPKQELQDTPTVAVERTTLTPTSTIEVTNTPVPVITLPADTDCELPVKAEPVSRENYQSFLFSDPQIKVCEVEGNLESAHLRQTNGLSPRAINLEITKGTEKKIISSDEQLLKEMFPIVAGEEDRVRAFMLATNDNVLTQRDVARLAKHYEEMGTTLESSLNIQIDEDWVEVETWEASRFGCFDIGSEGNPVYNANDVTKSKYLVYQASFPSDSGFAPDIDENNQHVSRISGPDPIAQLQVQTPSAVKICVD